MSGAAAERHGRSRPDACSVIWDKAKASALGTAPVARFWVAVEQNGPWGAQAATQSHLDPDLGESLNRMCQNAGGRFILIRRPGTHSDLPEVRGHRVYLAGGLAGRPWLLEADLDHPAEVAGFGSGVKIDNIDAHLTHVDAHGVAISDDAAVSAAVDTVIAAFAHLGAVWIIAS